MAIFYDPPANIDDFSFHPDKTQALRQHWHDYIAKTVGKQAGLGGLFYDASHDPAPQNAAARAQIPWNGFPKSIWEWFGADASPAGRARALAAAETLSRFDVMRPSDHAILPIYARQQDEYCEWHADRKDGHITRISFTCEGPEYWQIMWATDPDLVLNLYKTHISDAVTKEDLFWPEDIKDLNGDSIQEDEDSPPLFTRGSYNKWNRWNTQLGAMHLTHAANTLGAEIKLAADATHLFTQVSEEPAFSLPNRLMCCAGYGGVNRSSDPLIGAGVNSYARQGKSVTLANPIGLYIKEIPIDGLHAPDGTSIGPQCLDIVRSSPDKSLILRAEITPPPGANYTLDECTFEGVRINGGGQIARRITMSLFGLAKDVPDAQGIRQDVCKHKCCKKTSSNFEAIVPPNKDCASMNAADWNEYAPLEPGSAGAVVVAANEDRQDTHELSAKKLKSILGNSRAGM